MKNIEIMNNVFHSVELKKSSFMQKLFKQQPEANAVIELNNLLATRSILSVDQKDIDAINKKYGIDIYTEYGKNLLEFYASYLNDCLAHNKLSAQEISEVKHLQYILKINSSIAERIKQDLGGTVYKIWYREIVSDGILEGKKMEKLTQLKNQLVFSDQFTTKIHQEINKEYLDGYLKKLVEKGKMSPSDKTDFDNTISSLRLKDFVTEEIKSTVNDLTTYWEIENLGLSPIEVDVKLPKGEECYFSISANWLELKPSVAGQIYGKMRLSKIKIQKPFSRRSTIEDRLTDRGMLYLTNKKILFVGEKKHTIKLDVIDYIKPFSNGVAIDKEAGRDIFLEFGGRQDLFCLMLGKVNE